MVKKIIIFIAILLCLGGVGIGIFSLGGTKDIPGGDVNQVITTNKKEKATFYANIAVLNQGEENLKDEKLNKIFEKELEVNNADSSVTYEFQASVVNDKGVQYTDVDGKPLVIKKDVIIGKENAKLYITITGNKTMLEHLTKLKKLQNIQFKSQLVVKKEK